MALPHVDVKYCDGETFGYQYAGPAAQAMLGMNFPVGKRLFLGGKYRLSWAQLDTTLHDGMSLQIDALTQHLNIGIGISFGN